MAYETYRLTFKSQEQRGASQPNILEVQFDNEADAIQFGHNVEVVASAQLVSVDKLMRSDYTLPYPAGRNAMARCQVRDDNLHVSQFRVFDLVSTFVGETRTAALVAAGFQFANSDRSEFFPAHSIVPAVFTPDPSE